MGMGLVVVSRQNVQLRKELSAKRTTQASNLRLVVLYDRAGTPDVDTQIQKVVATYLDQGAATELPNGQNAFTKE
jgi:hypothetical protein